MDSVQTLSVLVALIVGAALGFLGAVPLLYVLHRAVRAKRGECKAPSVPVGFAAIVQSGLIVTIGIWLSYLYVPGSFVAISITSVLVMLAVTLIGGLTAWRTLATPRRN